MKNIQKLDVLILGAGGGGYPAAFFLAKAGLKVAMVDRFGNLGGDCLAEGCVPSKALRESTFLRSLCQKFTYFGLRGAQPDFDWQAILAHKDKVQQARYTQHTQQIAASSLIFHHGEGRLISPHVAEIRLASAETVTYEFTWLIIATGSRPSRLAIPGAELALTSHDIFRLNADLPLPKQLVVVGGGYIGAETACMLSALDVKITLLEASDGLMPGIDAELREFLTTQLGKKFTICPHATASEIHARKAGQLTVRYQNTQTGKAGEITAESVLMATGRVPVLPEGIANLGLPNHGAIPVDNTLRTPVAHVYAPGDVNGKSMLFHSAVRQSLVAAHNILAGGQVLNRMNFHSVPFTVFTDPELAWVGLDADAARRQGLEVSVVRYEYQTDSRAQIFAATDGFIKLVFDKATSRLVGAQIAGMDAAHVIAPLALAVEEESTAYALTNMVFPHPMITEGINKAARKFYP